MNKLLENNILRLRAPEPEDLDMLYAWENDSAIWKHGASIAPLSRYSIEQYLIGYKHDIYVDKQLRLMITIRETEECIGTIDLYDFDPFHKRAGVGILVDRKHRRKGHALQTLMLLEEYAFRFLNLKQLHAIISAKNNSSIRLFNRAGYRQAGILKEWLSCGNLFDDALVMQKIKSSGA